MFEKYDAYKDSGVEWLGKIPANWTCIKMKFLYSDVSIKGRENAELLSVTQDRGVIPRIWVENRMVMPSGNLESFKYIQKGDFAISLRSFEGGLEYCYHDGIISPAYTVLKKKIDDLKEGYYKYLFKSKIFISELQTSIVGIREGKNISYEELRYSYLPIPSEIEQHKIACYLDQKATEIDQAIAIKEQQIALLNERKQIVIQKAVTQGLDPNVQMKDSGVEWIGQIPEHWKVLKFKRACQFIYDGTHGSYPRVEQGYRLLSVRNIIDNEFVFREDDSCVSQKHFKEISSKFLIRNDDIQLAIVGGTLGKAAIVKNLEEDIVTQRSLATLRTQPKVLNPNFLLSFIRSPKYQNFLWSNAGFSAQPGVYLNTIQNSYLCMPCLKEQNLITEYIESETTKFSYLIGNIKEQIEKLKEYKTTLINDAVTGKIKVA